MIMTPFTIICDSNEGAPFGFRNMHATQRSKNGPIIATWEETDDTSPLFVDTETEALWSKGGADYTIKGMEHQIQVEAKHSVNDLFASCGRRRKNFSAEIARLNKRCRYSLVIITATWQQIMAGVPESDMNPQAVINTIISWQIRYPFVHWLLTPTRALSELFCFQTLEMYERKYRIK